MIPKPIRILLIEDNAGDAEMVRELLRDSMAEPFDLEHADRLSKGLAILQRKNIHIILLDLHLPDCNGLETFYRVHAKCDHVPIVILSGADDENSALEAVRKGAQDFLVKGYFDSHRLVRSVKFALERVVWMDHHQIEHSEFAEMLASLRERLSRLSARESEVLDEIAEGKSLKQIAEEFGTSYFTVKNQRASIVKKLEVQSDAALVRMVMILRFGHEPEHNK